MKVGICIATYRRPLLLGRLLESLGGLTFPRNPEIQPVVIVVDNDRKGSAGEIVERFRSLVPWPILYEVEPRRNISLARNRGVELALKLDPEFLAFIDDDEAARPDWLDELMSVQKLFGADIVGGTVVPRYEEGIPHWILRGGFFKQPSFSTGTPVRLVHTNNSLVARGLFTDSAWRFDPGFGLSGGGDCHFFMRAHRAGASLVWAEEAVVEEFIPSTRAKSDWILRRAFRIGNAGVHCERAILPTYRWLPLRLAKAGFRIVEGLLLTGVSLPRGRAATMNALCKVAYGSGSIAAIAGIRYYEYLVVHGK